MSREQPSYRADIDGLRAVAVTSVLVFHGFPGVIPGGFAGVDIFFVISGFLISGIILGKLRAGTFTFSDFYSRRIRRIFPALALVLTACLVFGWKLLLPIEFAQLGRHLSAGALFISNLALWDEAGYFDTAAAVKPLLHLWSLGIEEQYYIFWPLLLFVLRRHLHRLVWLIGIGAIGSFAFNLILVRNHPDAAFYSPASRGWELLVGSMLAYVSLFHARIAAGMERAGNALSFAGAALIVAGLVLLNESRDFPGWWALLPTLGAALLIAAGPKGWINRLVLANPVAVFVGLISYPLYLWHWPILTFARIYVGDTPPWPVRLAGLVAAVVLATATWWFIERPIRGAWVRRWPKYSVGTLATAVAVIGLLGALALNDVFRAESAASARATEVSRAVLDWEEDKTDRLPGDVPETVMFFGDSHMRQYWPRIKQVADGARPTRAVIFQTKNGCAPIPGVDRKGRDCDDFVEQGFARAHAPEVRTVVIAASWHGFVTRTDYYKVGEESGAPLVLLTPQTKWVMEGFEQQVEDLEEHGKQVVILLSSPRNDDLDPKRLLYRDGLTWREREAPQVPLRIVDAESAQVDAVLRGIAARTGASLLDPSDWLCGKQYCPPVDEQGRPIYVDGSHVRASIMRERIDALDRFVYADGAVSASLPARPAYAASR